MVSRRSNYSPFEPSHETRWLTVRNMHQSLLEHRLLPKGADLNAAFVIALAEHVRDGWRLENFSSSHACAFCKRGEERRAIALEAEDPTKPLPKHSLQFR